jgi:hypothetical protein
MKIIYKIKNVEDGVSASVKLNASSDFVVVLHDDDVNEIVGVRIFPASKFTFEHAKNQAHEWVNV